MKNEIVFSLIGLTDEPTRATLVIPEVPDATKIHLEKQFEKELVKLTAPTVDFVTKHNLVDGDEQKIMIIAQTGAATGMAACPCLDALSDALKWVAFFFAFSYVYDDLLEDVIKTNKLSVSDIRRFLHEMCDRLQGRYVENGLKNFPKALEIAAIMDDLLEKGRSWFPHYDGSIGYFIESFMAYLQSNLWQHATRKKNSMYSETSILELRRNDAAVELLVRSYNLVTGLTILPEISSSPPFRHLHSLVGVYLAVQNDVMSIKKDMGDDTLNVIFHLAEKKGISTVDAMKLRCQLMDEVLEDIEITKTALIDIYGPDESLEKWTVKITEICYACVVHFYKSTPGRYKHFIKF